MIHGAHRILVGDVLDGLRSLEAGSVRCCVTSPPYWGLRDYGVEGQIGLEATPEAFIGRMVEVFREVRRVLAEDGTIWVNMGDSYSRAPEKSGNKTPNGRNTAEISYGIAQRSKIGSSDGAVGRGDRPGTRATADGIKPKDLVGIPWMLAFALRADGWYLRSDIIWHKCLSGGAVVYAQTAKGEMPMTVKDVVRLDPATVRLWDGGKWNQVVSWTPSPAKGDGLELELRNGARIGCTPEHRWPTARGLLEASAIVPGDVLESGTLPEPEVPRQPSMLPDEDVGWFVGLYIAEGSRSDGTIQVASHLSQEERFERLRGIARACDGYCSVHQTSENGATANINSPVLLGVVDAYVSGRTAKDKHLSPHCWKRSNRFLRAVLDGYLSGDGHQAPDGRWRLGFCDNDSLASDLRTIGARLGASVRLKRCVHQMGERMFPGWRGSLYFDPSRRKRSDYEVVAVRRSRARMFWDIALADEPHLFTLACGVRTHNSNPMPESVTDRPTKSHEYIFLLSKSQRYYYDAEAVKEAGSPNTHSRGAAGAGPEKSSISYKTDAPGSGNRNNSDFQRYMADRPVGHPRNARSVWTIATQAYSEAHFATFPEALPERCIKAGSSEKGQCPACRKPWVRVVEKSGGTTGTDWHPRDRVNDGLVADKRGGHAEWADYKCRTLGWRPTCEGCDHYPRVAEWREVPAQGKDEPDEQYAARVAPIIALRADLLALWRPLPTDPDVVLDPFAGSGTTLLVANKLGRDAVGCELNPEYAAMAERRIGRGLRPSTFRDAAPEESPLFQAV